MEQAGGGGAGALQFRLLLWKDYLIRKRKPITLAGILWAVGIIFSLYVVRINIDDQDFPTCQFPARALPSAGVMTFLQSLLCSINNECTPLDQYEEIPTYEDSKLTQIKRQFSPLLYNESVVDVASTVPGALKLLATLAAVVDEPTFVNISKNGLKVDELFNNPTRVRRYLEARLDLNDDVAQDIMQSSLSFQGILKGSLDRCKSKSISETLVLKNSEHLDILEKKLCSLTNQEVQTILMDLLLQVNFSKYINMLGNMYFKMTGDNRLSSLAGTITAVLRMSRLESFLPPEMVTILQGKQADFSYFHLDLIPKFVELFKPTFRDTDAYQTIQQFADMAVIGVQYLDKFLVKQINESAKVKVSVRNGVSSNNTIDFKAVTRAFSNAVEVFKDAIAIDSSVDVFNVLSKLTNFIYKLLPEKQRYIVLFFSTLVTKLIESANQVIQINTHIEERVYNVSLRHPEGVKILVGLSSNIIAKGFEGLTDAKRTQIVTAKINTPDQMFCDVNRIQGFFKVSQEEAKSLKSKLCSNAWKNYIADLIRSFGVYDVRDNINAMASLVIKDTFGKDVTKDLYTIDYDFLVLKNFTKTLSSIPRESRPALDWTKLFNVTKDSGFMKTVQDKGHLGKQMLVIAHGAIAKEVVNQNNILSYKISPLLVDATTLVVALNRQLDATPQHVARNMREMYPAVLLTVLSTAFDQDKTYRSLSAHSLDIMCNGVDNSLQYLSFPPTVDRERLVSTLCDISTAIENGLKNDSAIGKAVANLRNSSHKSQNVDWTGLISGMKDLYVKLDRDYPYLFEYGSYGMDASTRVRVNEMVDKAKEFWFGKDSLGRSLHLSIKLGFRLLDLLDRGMFSLADEVWLKMKYTLSAVGGPLRVLHDFVKVVSAISRNESYSSALPAATAAALSTVIPSVPQLIVDAADLIVRDDTETEPIIMALNADPPWPCSARSLAELLRVSARAGASVRALERVLCMHEQDQLEWQHYLETRDVTVFNFKNWNKTTYGPHDFLKMSATFDSLAEDVTQVPQLLEDMTERSAPGGRLSMADAWNTAWDMLNGVDRDAVLKKFFTKLDTVVNAVNTSTLADGASLNVAWAQYRACSNGSLIQDSCKAVGRAAWKHSIEFVSVLVQNAAMDLFTYFKEINEPNYSILQVFGFTRSTALYEMYDKLPEFMGVLLNSYFDYGFMSQIRRASNSQFWDCEALVESLVPPPGSRIDSATLLRVQPYVCPSLFHWLSFPRGENTLMDIIAKPQYYLFTMHVQNLTSNYSDAYEKGTELSKFLTNITNLNKTLLSADDFKISNLQKKLNNLVDSFVNFKINDTDSSYRQFSEISKKQYTSIIYLTRIVTISNKLVTALDNLNITDFEDNHNNLEAELTSIQKIFKRRPHEAIALHFDVLSKVLWKNDENYNIINALDETCNDLKNNSTKDILVETQRVKNLVCSKRYKLIYGAINNVIQEDYVKARKMLLNLVRTLQDGEIDNVTDISEFFNQRQQLTRYLKTSVNYAFEVGTPIYLQYLQSNLRHYDVILTFMSGGDWWAELRALYRGPYARDFFDSMQKSLDVVEDIMSNPDKIHLVRLLRDINVNNSDAFCQPAITLSDYLPDGAGVLSQLKRRMCDIERTQLFRELPPLLFASQGYDDSLKLPKVVNYTAINLDLSRTELGLELIENGPQVPQRPRWITDDKLAHLKTVMLRLLSKQTLTRISFGVLSNLVDAGTLFLNNSQCTLCSELTSWLKQLNLQVFKKQEYDSLLCHLQTLTLEDVYQTLKNDFHWDMAIKELLLTRNYTKYELNKSLNEFLELVKLHLLDDMSVNVTKLADCLARNVTRNAFGNAALVAYILSSTARLIRAEAPHLHEVDGITNLTYLKQLSVDVAHNLDVQAPLKSYLTGGDVTELLSRIVRDTSVVDDIMEGDVKLNAIQNDLLPLSRRVTLRNNSWEDVCREYDCTEIARVIDNNVNITLVDRYLQKLQTQEFWRFTFVSNIVSHVEDLLSHGGRLLGVASQMNVSGVMEGRLEALADFLMQILEDDNIDDIIYSLQGIISEVKPLLQGAPLEVDLKALVTGLAILRQFKHYLLQQDELKVSVSELFPDAEGVESSLSELGINNTNFWSVAAPRLRAGHINLAPLLSSKQGDYHINDFTCQLVPMSQVLLPSALDVVTADDVLGAVAEQFCELPDELAKQVVTVLWENLNTSIILDKVKNTLLMSLFSASNLTSAEGAAVLEKAPQMAALLPVIRDNMGGMVETIADEPLLRSLKNFSSIGGLLSSPSFMEDAGAMLCGKPFHTEIARIYKSVMQTQDLTSQPDQAQLDALPTDFCRSLYKDIIGIEAGKIVWSFVKPLLMGKILYTPDNPRVGMIMKKANESFATTIKVMNIVHSFADSFPSLDILSDHRAGITALRSLITEPSFSALREMIIGDGDIPDIDVDVLFDEFGDTNGIGRLLSKASDLLRCVNMNRFHAVPDEYQLTHEAVKLSRVNEFAAGIVFLNSEKKGEVPTNVEYKIRMDIENAPTTTRKTSYFWIPGPESSFIENMRYFRGFIEIQDIVDKAIIGLSHSNSRIHKRETEREEPEWAMYTQQEPYPCFRRDFYQTSLYESQALMVAFFFSLLFTVCSAVRFIVSDKESGNTMLMSVMGVDLTYHSLSWTVATLAELLVTCACVTTVLCWGGVLPHTQPSLVFVVVMAFSVSVLAYCYLMSKVFSTASSAAVVTGIVYLLSFMPFVIILSLEAIISATVKYLVCLSMTSAICYSLLMITRAEAMGRGAAWADVFTAPSEGDLSIAEGLIMALVDAVIYFAIGYLLDRYFGPKTLQSSITHTTTSGEKAGVSIVNVSKVYGEGTRRPKMALDNVSIELTKGQITTLLGHNGAGKTTLIGILTGTLKPSSGHVTIRSEVSLGARVGLCPQRDVLFEYMTAREHVALYAQLKSGKPLKDVRDDVQSMLSVLSLGALAAEPVVRLSGGTRRRLCVALAFVARPHLVSLDEPTAGVDPAARRDIWSLIVKLRQDRTILMTTHHLDEAELLSDQIVIMHKGQVHTTGSPIEIKRSLGNGYKLIVMYPNKKLSYDEPWLEDEGEDLSIEEKTKLLLAVVRDCIKNANLVDVNNAEVEIALPFYDANGLNNNFLQLCTALESRKAELGYRSYSLDCSSLEQVFFNICQEADAPHNGIEYDPEIPSKSPSTSSIKSDQTPLVPAEGPLKGSQWQQFSALLHARYLHYTRNKWLLFLLLVLPALFVLIAMGFSLVRPPPDNEISLRLHPGLYEDTTQYLVRNPSINSENFDPSFAQRVMDALKLDQQTRNWTEAETPTCVCTETRQDCELNADSFKNHPKMMMLPDTDTLNHWIVASTDVYIEKRYGGFSSSLKNNVTNLVAWYNNKGHHAMPAFLNALNTALLKTVSSDPSASITVYSHPLKISKEQVSKDTVYQHVADAGISALMVLAYSLVSGGAAIYLVNTRRSQEKRLQLLCGVTPALYWASALAADIVVVAINIVMTAIMLEAFGFPVFIARNNLPAICLMLVLYGYSCGSLVHIAEKLFSEASLANMLLFCGNTFVGLGGLTLLLVLDIISDSDTTDNVRWYLHKIFLVFPQFALADGLLEIAKNTIQAEVLYHFGMDTYKDPLSTSLVAYHYLSLVVVGTALLLLNLAIEYHWFDSILTRFTSESLSEGSEGELEDLEVSAERRRVQDAVARAESAVRLPTIGNINAGFVDTEVKKNSIKRVVSTASDAAQCVALGKAYPALQGRRVAVRALTLGIHAGQCTALLGQNGAGKSTTFAMLTGEVRPTTGQIYLNERRVDCITLCQGLISYCPQSDALDPLITVRETLKFYCRLRGITDHDEVIKRTLEMCDLKKYADVRNGTLSGGNKRKLCTAIAFMGRTPLVLLDEPTSGMDPGSRVCVSRGVQVACATQRGVLLSTHALDDARRLAARVALMRAGSLCALATLDDCLKRFGGGYAVACRVSRGGAREVWRRVRAGAPHATLRVLHYAIVHFTLPLHATVNQKEVTTSLSDVFRLMSELQATCDIEDFTVNQSSLDQMFLSFTDKAEGLEPVDLEPLPSPAVLHKDHTDLDTVTSL